MKLRARHIVITVAAIVVMLLALPLLVYVPPVQKWLVDKATVMASEATGLNISIRAVSLRFPLTLSLEDVMVTRPLDSDTIASVGRIDASLAVLPLFSLRAELGGLAINEARLNTLDLISDTQVQGNIGQLAIGSTMADINAGKVDVSSLLLADADLCILLSDTAAVDTTESEALPWLIALREASLNNVSCEVHLPGDSMIVATTLTKVVAADAIIDLLQERYALASLQIDQSALVYDLPYEPALEQTADDQLMDYSHLSFTDLSLTVDSIVYLSPDLTLAVRHASLKESCGFQVTDLSASITLDSLGIRLPSLTLSTPSSSLIGQASIDYASFDAQQIVNSKSVNSKFLIDASLSRHDIAHFYPVKGLPEWPLTIKAKANGNLAYANIEEFTLDIPTALHAEASGIFALNAQHSLAEPVGARNLNFKLSLQNPSFLHSTLGIDTKSLNIPAGLHLDGTVSSIGPQYTANLTARDGQATINGRALLDTQTEAYTVDLDIADLNTGRYVPAVDCILHQATFSVRGHGYDPYSPKTFIEAATTIDSLTYDQWRADSIHLAATIEDARTTATLALHKVQGTGISGRRLNIGLNGDIKVETNLKDSHKLSGLLKDFEITDSTGTYHPENLGVLLAARPDTTYVRVQNGNFIVKLDASGSYDRLLQSLTALADTIDHQLDNRIIDQGLLKQMLPTMRLYITSGRENVAARFLRASRDIDYKELLADITMSATQGVNGQMYIHDLGISSTRIDTALVTLKDSDHGLTYQARVANGRKNKTPLIALMDGHLYEHGARVGLRVFDKDGRMGLRIGTQASMESDGMHFKLLPKNPTIAHREFTLNDDNYLFLRNDTRLSAKLEMEDNEGTTIDVYSEEADSTRLQDLTVSVAKLNLKQLTAALPFMPAIEGFLNGDFHIIMDQQKQISVAADVDVDNMVYEGNVIGNINTEFVYLQNTDNTHSIDGILLREDKQVASLEGKYINKKVSNGHEHADVLLSLVNTPLNMANGFITDHIVGLEGYANGQLSLNGPLDNLIVDGSVRLDSATIFSTPYGIRMGIDDTPIKIEHSKLTLNDFKLYASPEYREKGVLESTFNFVNKAIGAVQSADTVAYVTITGTADFSGDGPAPLDFRIRAKELQLINSRQQIGSLLYGKGFVSFMTMVRGTTEKMTVRGRLNVLGKTDLTYLLLDSPLSTDNQMDELVKFTDFNDSTQISVVHRPVPNGMDVNLTVSIDQGAHIRCGLNADQSNYVDIFGGGELRLRMSETEEMSLTGRYTLTSGTMKYSLPVIPLKTFTIQDGSYVEFTGAMDNPTLNITATERTRATVGQEGSQARSVTFDCGVVLTKTLNDMGFQFIISAPEDMTVQSELQAMTVEQRSKLAVTMLTTGMYLADGNTAGFSMNAALSSFLQSEINNIAGNALSSLDISMGIDNSTDASGNVHTDYSFQFAKRFWNNRLKVQIGGKVSSGQEMQGQKQSFFDNVSMEYRLSPTSNQYLKLFYKQNVYDWLDGYTGEYGVGYIYKRKMDHWWDMFQLWKKDSNNNRNR